MKFKLDENLGRPCAGRLREAGHDVETVPSEGLCSASDTVLAERCRAEDRCLVTLDLDFTDPLRFRHSDYPGFAVLRLPARPTAADLLDRVDTLLRGVAVNDIRGKLWIVEKNRIREHIEG